MAKASDILNKSGSGGIGPGGAGTPKSIFGATPKATDKDKETKNQAEKPDMGHGPHKPVKAMGGGGGSAARPKV